MIINRTNLIVRAEDFPSEELTTSRAEDFLSKELKTSRAEDFLSEELTIVRAEIFPPSSEQVRRNVR